MTLRDRKPMRQGQQNRRGRGRNRKSQNPLTRSFESNGPDVKIRGTPAHVAEKYMNLARDALSSGDRVLAENYLQHAEHYNRIIMAYRESQAAQQPQPDTINGAGRTSNRQPGAENDDDQTEEERTEASAEADTAQPQRQSNSGNGGSRSRQPRGSRRQSNRDRSADSEQPETGRSQGGRGGEQRKAARFGGADDQPEFLRRPVRRSRRDNANDGGQPEVEAVSDEEKAD